MGFNCILFSNPFSEKCEGGNPLNPSCEICSKIKEEYGIKTGNEIINFYKANNFIKEVFKAGWSHPYGFRDHAIRRGYAVRDKKGNIKDVWKISFKDIFWMMTDPIPYYKLTPIFKKLNKGTDNG